MTISSEILEFHFTEFSKFVSVKDNKQFSHFGTSKYINNEENYKYSVYEEARENLGNKRWKPLDIGTGKIQRCVNLSIKTKVNHNGRIVDNNLIDWRKKDEFAKRNESKEFEETLFNFYKSKIKDSEAFDLFIKEKLTYQFIAYLFFIKDSQRFLPISQVRFDEIFTQLGISDFKTRSNISWENYSEFCNIIKQVQGFLKTKDEDATLLDAHSFLWIIGTQMKIVNKSNADKDLKKVIKENELKVNLKSKASELNRLMWIEILQDNKITNELDLSIFQTLYSFQEHKAFASQIAIILNTTHPPLNLEIGRYAKRIAEKYDINFTARNQEKYKFWDLFFIGRDEGSKFIWQLRPELIQALIDTKLTGEEILAEEFTTETSEELFEGIKKTVTVNSYERNPKARELCVKHWGAICSVCSIDFENTYGEIGKGFIHVHHLTPVSIIGKNYIVDPINDLIPVCPNCHAMLHRQVPPLTINELKKTLFK